MFNPREDIERRAVDRLAALPFDKETGQTSRSAYENRLGHELECIREFGLESRIAAASDLVDHAESNGILVGPGRRAGPSSLVLYLRERYDGDVDGISVLGMKQLSQLSEACKGGEFGHPGTRFWHHAGGEVDETTMQLFRSGKTDRVFQFSARGMQDSLSEARPRDFKDLVTLSAAFRPAFLTGGVFEEVVRRMKTRDWHAPESTACVIPEDRLREIGAVNEPLAETFGLMLFQEEFIEIVHRLSGWRYRESEQYRGQVKSEFHDKLIDRATEIRSVSERHEDDLRTLISHSRNTVLKSHVLAYALVGWMQAKLLT